MRLSSENPVSKFAFKLTLRRYTSGDKIIDFDKMAAQARVGCCTAVKIQSTT